MIAQRLRERLPGGGFHIHAGSPFGSDYTLCGYAHEGAALNDGEDHAVEAVSRGKISCGTCLRIIRYCKSIPASSLNWKAA